MDGVEMLVKRVIMACGVKAADLAAIEAFVPQLKDEIPKLRAAIPGYAIALRDKVESIEAKLAAIDSKLDQLLEMHGDHVTSQSLPASLDYNAGLGMFPSALGTAQDSAPGIDRDKAPGAAT